MSEGHRRQMEIFGQSAGRVVSGYSEEFLNDFVDHLRMAHPRARVSATVVYNEFIANKHHIHMNSTKWLTLTEFVKYLGREGICKVEETPKGWFMTLTNSDPQKAKEEEERRKREKHQLDEEGRMQRLLEEQVTRAHKVARTEGEQGEGDGESCSELKREALEEPIKLSLAPAGPAAAAAAGSSGRVGSHGEGRGGEESKGRAKPAVPLFGDGDDEEPSTSGAAASGAHPRKLSKVEELMKKDLEAKARREAAAAGPSGRSHEGGSSSSSRGGRVDHWLYPGIIVKVMSKALKEHGYYKQKGVVEQVIDKYIGEVSMLGSGDVIRVDQAELETVLPSPGGRVLVVNGIHRGTKGQLMGVDVKRFQAEVELGSGSSHGQRIWLDYEDVCKLA